ncbi:MAG: hypothetical protein ACR2RV_19495 [Verrucomicrobiales bacterium]
MIVLAENSERPRYFLQAHPALASRLEAHFDDLCARIERNPAIAAKVAAVVLGGGYGRGEGGVLVNPDGSEELFNDLDYFLFTEQPDDGDLRSLVHEIEKEGTAELGIDVDVKIERIDALPEPENSMMIYDLAAGHVVVYGDPAYLTSRWPNPEPSGIPIGEASRLLWNRGTGLYFAACRIAQREDRRFVERNHAKFKLAAGDALLCLEGRYHWSFRERQDRFRELATDQFGVGKLYEEGGAFKWGPSDGMLTWDELAEENRSLSDLWAKLFLHVESERLGVEFADAASYVAGRERRSPEVPRWKAPMFALRDLVRFRRCVGPVWDYPRTGLFRSLFCLLSDELPDPEKFLGKPAGDGRAAWEPTYKFWWERYG